MTCQLQLLGRTTPTMRINKSYVLAGAGLYAGVAAAAYIRVKGSQASPHSLACKHEPGAAFDALADSYDQQIGWDEKLMGISLMRWWLIRQSKVSQHEALTKLANQSLALLSSCKAKRAGGIQGHRLVLQCQASKEIFTCHFM